MGGIRHVVQAVVAIVIHCIADISPVQVMYREGCIHKVTNVKAPIHLPNNYPGTCLSYCHRQKIPATYIALKDTECRCGVTSYTTLNSTKACNKTCPGHDAHFCGGLTDFSLYIIETENTVTDTSLCLSYKCGAQIPGAVDCSSTLPPLCVKLITRERNCSKATNSWNQALRECSVGNVFEERYFYLKNTQSVWNQLNIGSTSSCIPCQTSRWIGAFAVWAPPKSCNYRSLVIDHGNYTLPNIASGDNETIDYSCEGGYRLQGAVTWFCMANNSWVSAPWSQHKPACTSDVTSTSSPATAATSRHNVPTAAPGTNPSTTIVVAGSSTMDTTGLSAGVIAAIVIGTCIAVALVSAAIGFLLKKYILIGPKVGAADNWHDAVYNIRKKLSVHNLPDVSTTD